MYNALDVIANDIKLVITIPNADRLGSIFREKLEELKKRKPDCIFLVENFGKQNYFSAMYHAEFLIGNTSSGIIEAASFNKFVLNVGDRQKGRVQSENIINVAFSSSKMICKASEMLQKGNYKGNNLYYKENSVEQIMEVILNHIE